MRLSIHVGAVIFVTVLVCSCATLSLTDKTSINNGLAAGTAIANSIEKFDFTDTMTKVASKVAPFLGALGPIVGFILGVIPSSESKMLHDLRQSMIHIDHRLDVLDGKFTDLNRKIDYQSIKIRFGIVESKILAMSTQFQKMYNAPAGAVKQEKQDFIDNYNSDYQNSGDKIVEGILHEKGTFTESLGSAAMEYSEYDRKEVQEYLLGLMKLVLTAAKIELAYKMAKGVNSADFNYNKGLWEDKIKKVRAKMIAIDRAVVAKYRDQMTKDVERYASDHSDLSHGDFGRNVYHDLVDKFYWRDWMVLSYNDITGGDKHYQHACDGYLRFRFKGRNIVVASVDKKKRHVAHSTALSVLTHAKTYTTHTNPRLHQSGAVIYSKIKAEDVFNSFPSQDRAHCSPYASIGLVQDGAGQHYEGLSSRLVQIHQRYYTLHIFG